MSNFRHDLFLRDFKAHLKKDIRTLDEIAHACGCNAITLKNIRDEKTKKPHLGVLVGICQDMKRYYGFYVENE